jgi:hypothetical protein
MAATVITLRNTEGGIYSKDVYEKGTNVVINDGHLAITAYRNGQWLTLGAYAPGNWHSVFTDEDAKIDAVE